MQIRELTPLDRFETLNLFRTVFTESEGVEAGKMLESLVGKVFDSLGAPAIFGFGGYLALLLTKCLFKHFLDFTSIGWVSFVLRLANHFVQFIL